MQEPIFSLNCGAIKLHSMPLQSLFDVNGNGFRQVVSVNGEVFVYAHTDQRLNRIMRATINPIDGRVLQGICQLLYPRHKIVRHMGSSFVFDLAAFCAKHSQRLFLLGASENSNASAVERLRKESPGLQVRGFSPPAQDYPFDPGWNEGVLKHVEEFRPHQLVVCFGAKKQDYWIYDNSSRLSELGVHRAYGLGATIDFVAGVKPRAPKWIQSMGAEWLFRLVRERGRFGRTLLMFKMPFYAAKTVREISPVNGIRE